MKHQIKITVGNTTLLLSDAMELCKQLSPLFSGSTAETETVRKVAPAPQPQKPKSRKSLLWHSFNVAFSKQTLRRLNEDARQQKIKAGELALRLALAQLQNTGEPPRVKTTRKFRKAKRVRITVPNGDRLAFIKDATEKAYVGQAVAPTIRRLVELYYEGKPTTLNRFNHQPSTN